MKRVRTKRGRGLSIIVVVAALLGGTAPGHARAAGSLQAQALANLVVRTVICFAHPCIGETRSEVRQLLKGRLVSDGYFDYSDLGMAYPSVRGVLQGVVEWNLEGTLQDISLIIVDFQVPHDVLREELERTLPGCEIETDSEDHDTADDAEEVGGATAEWECSVHLDEDHEFDVTIHLAPELAMVEIEP